MRRGKVKNNFGYWECRYPPAQTLGSGSRCGRFVGAWRIEGEILRCAQDDRVTATAKTSGYGKGQQQKAQLKLSARGGVGGFVVR